jgi:hypothetical protein
MRRPTRRSLRRSQGSIAPSLVVSGGPDAAIDGTSRRAFLGTAGAAAGAAALLVAPKAASVALEAHGSAPDAKTVLTERSGPAPAEPVTAYVHNADRNEVVVMWGQKETTYRDPVLVKRLLDATR